MLRPQRRTRQRLQELDEVALLLVAQAEAEELVVVGHHVDQRCKTSVVVEAALLMCPQSGERTRAVAVVGRAIRLEIVDADLAGGMQVPPGLGVQRRNVTARTL